MNGPHLDAAILSSRAAVDIHRGDSQILHSYVYTLALLAAALNTGMNDGLVGPTMADLELVTGGSPEAVSVMFMLRALFIVVGTVVSGHWLKRHPGRQPNLIGACLILESIFGTIIPWLPSTGLVDLFSGISALFTGGIITGAYNCMHYIWEERRLGAIRALRLSYTLGMGMASLIALPFLWTNSYGNPSQQEIDNQEEACTNEINSSIIDNMRGQEITHVQAAYFIVALSGLMLSIAFFWLPPLTNVEEHVEESQRKRPTYKQINSRQAHQDGCLSFSIYFLFMGFTAICGGMEITFTGLLISFNYDFLHWGKKEAVLMSALYQMVKFFFAILGVILSKWIPYSFMLFWEVLILTTTSVYLIMTISHSHHASMWTATFFFAVGNSSLFPACLAWIGQKVNTWKILPKLFNMSFCVGVMILPFLTAHLLVRYGFKSFPWVILVCSSLGFILFLTLLILLELCPYVCYNQRKELQHLVYQDPEHPTMWTI